MKKFCTSDDLCGGTTGSEAVKQADMARDDLSLAEPCLGSSGVVTPAPVQVWQVESESKSKKQNGHRETNGSLVLLLSYQIG